mmetsp:Transcript_7090/g.13689  ORF Transcript_7090/g.13689 Transcript_7090/m.13689 type:complete len:140 (-) Transcript_7090:127-546(-)|eukprot:CAMPEP_0173377388 /NCGR_PEP_ID=MMETSP1356-20130122/599_1 /TAXON_ID=77927 ORGANISM="Hemiselmis virescens, Strain PCC157" /NCGR_SAMPLE_ID=MMETSP1356 /ASSEMBLY_ACC=CAM_ASM_000847 /LENGTH=139 /DNA_ID=CAMNT_0014330099 /DNA_START=221 /DNA_END=640 /DNA_ORIENTATION=-
MNSVLSGWAGLWRTAPAAAKGMIQAAVPGTQRNIAVKMRLQRWGAKGFPFYRIVAAHTRSPRDGKCLDYLGTYNPLANKHGEKLVTLNIKRIKYWLVCGAQPTPTVAFLLGNANVLPAPLRYHWKEPKNKGKGEEGAKE